jgi:O-antigen/teichoic acid export membrane protein
MDHVAIGDEAQRQNARSYRLVFRNAVLLMLAQALGVPLSIAVNALMARSVGPKDYGYVYLAGTIVSFDMLAIEWGQSSTLPAMIAKDRSRAAELLGTGIVWRVVSSLVVFGATAFVCHLLRYEVRFELVFVLAALGWAIGTVSSAYLDVIRGCERMDIAGYAYVAQQMLNLTLVAMVIFAGGRLFSMLLVLAISPIFILPFIARGLRSIGIGSLAVRRDALTSILKGGAPFLLFGLAMVLQPNVDAIVLSKMAPLETVGWFAASRRLIGVLVYPASALTSALYPTLSRLHVEDRAAFLQTASSALCTTAILVVPIAIGCAVYPDLGIRLFNRQTFGPAEDNLRILSLFLLLVYFTMVIGCCLLAAGRPRAWALTQALCVIVSAIADPILVPWFQRRAGNGGLGVCVSGVASEVLMLVVGCALVPRGLFRRALGKQLLLVAIAGLGMFAASRLLGTFRSLVAAPISVALYFGCLWLVGGVDDRQKQMIRGIVARKMTPK